MMRAAFSSAGHALRRLTLVLGLVILWSASSCDPRPATEIIVSIYADAVIAPDLDRISLTVQRGENGPRFVKMNSPERSDDAGFFVAPAVSNGRMLPAHITLVPRDPSDGTQVQLTVQGRLRDGTLVSQRTVAAFVEQRSLYILMSLSNRCLRHSCGDGETCSLGQCRQLPPHPVTETPSPDPFQDADASDDASIDSPYDSPDVRNDTMDADVTAVRDTDIQEAFDADVPNMDRPQDADVPMAPDVDVALDVDVPGDVPNEMDRSDVIAEDASMDLLDVRGDRDAAMDLPDDGRSVAPEVSVDMPDADVPRDMPDADAVDAANPIVQISLSGDVSCARRARGEVFCWGDNIWSQTNPSGDAGAGASTPTPTRMPGSMRTVAAGGAAVIAIESASGLVVWQTRGYEPTTGTVIRGALDLGAGFYHHCVHLDGGTVQCWAQNYGGELGRGTTSPMERSVDYVRIPDGGMLTGTRRLVVGHLMNCSLRTDGELWCWGTYNVDQLLVAGAAESVLFASRVQLPAAVSSRVRQVGIGRSYICVSSEVDQHVYCGGSFYESSAGTGALDDQLRMDMAAPVQGSDRSPLSVALNDGSLAVGWRHGCALAPPVGGGSAIYCWGGNEFGQVGANDAGLDAGQTLPFAARVTGVPPATQIASGQEHTCALTLDGRVFCWGKNDYGQLGSGTVGGRRQTPAPVSIPES